MLDRPSNLPFRWTDGAVETLKRLWGEGLSASEVATQMGGGLSRSAIIGKVHRLKLKRAIDGTQTSSIAIKAHHARLSRRESPAFEIAPLPEEELGNDVTHLLGLMDLGRISCRWPVTGEGAQTLFCGERASHGPYCPSHSARAGLGYGRGAQP